MALISAFFEILQRPTILEMVFELISFLTPIWVAIVIGVLVGWAWKPKWVNPNVVLDSNVEKSWFLSSLKLQLPSSISWISQFGIGSEDSSLVTCESSNNNSSLKLETENSSHVNGNDVRHLYNLVEEKDGGPVWMEMMDRSTSNMSYQAWKREPETGPPQYRSRTVYEDATPELLRDFFWDDEFRMKWDDMILYAETLEECHTTGTMVVHWVRKFPFFCSDREYIIGRRIWESEGTYYCVTKGVQNSVPRRNKPRRVDLYYSSWCIRAVESKRDGRMTSCEVLLFHHEDMGIPWEIAKLGVRQGMWGAVRKIDRGMRMYQTHRASTEQLSPCALMAQINSKFSVDSIENLEIISCESEDDSDDGSIDSAEKSSGRSLSKFVFIGGAVALACSLDRGLLTKAVIFGVARRFARTGR